MTSLSEHELKKQIREKLTGFEPRAVHEPHVGEAAVLMGIFESEKQLYFLLTRRTAHVRTHKGQISFPGGARCDQEPLRTTALRETEEEIGIPAQDVEVISPFHRYMAVTEHLVTPFVAFLKEGFSLSPNPNEVEAVLAVPLDFFRETEAVMKMRVRLGREMPVYFYDYEGNTIWGLTAAMIKDFVELLKS